MGRPRRALAAVIGAVVVVLVALAIVFRPSDDAGGRRESPVAAASAAPASQAVTGLEVPPIGTCELLELDEFDLALGLTELPADERNFVTYGRGEGCEWRHALPSGEDGEGISIEPGDPADFEPTTTHDGVAGRRIEGIGAAAVWFGGPDSGALTVVEESTLGWVVLRVIVDRPSIDDAERLEVARGVVAAVLPRFPGMAAAAPEPEEVRIEHPASDRSGESYVANLLAREADGEWTRGEGLVATLELLLGEADADAVLRQPLLADEETTGILEMAREYVAQDDAEQTDEVEALLERLTLSAAELEEMAGVSQPTAMAGAMPRGVAQGAVENCARFYDYIVTGVGFCLEFESLMIKDKLYRVYYPAPSVPSAGWTRADYEVAVDAVRESVPVLDRYGTTPPTVLVFSISSEGTANARYEVAPPCVISLKRGLQGRPPAQQKQIIAHELVHCFSAETFKPQKKVDYEYRKWWDEGLSNYLSNVVYPDTGAELDSLALLESEELELTLVERVYPNWIFFQHRENRSSVRSAVRLVDSLATSGGLDDQEAALAKVDNIQQTMLTFVEGLTDASIRDPGPNRGPIPYNPDATYYVVARPSHIYGDPRRFGVTRINLVVEGGMYACVKVEASDTTEWAWRFGAPGAPGIEGPWRLDLPEVISGEIVLVATTTADDATFRVDVPYVGEDPECKPRPSIAPRGPTGAGGDCGLDLCEPSSYYRSEDDVADALDGGDGD